MATRRLRTISASDRSGWFSFRTNTDVLELVEAAEQAELGEDYMIEAQTRPEQPGASEGVGPDHAVNRIAHFQLLDRDPQAVGARQSARLDRVTCLDRSRLAGDPIERPGGTQDEVGALLEHLDAFSGRRGTDATSSALRPRHFGIPSSGDEALTHPVGCGCL
jgi:hypothetical protein